MKNLDLRQLQDRVASLKSQYDDLHFRKPWTTSHTSSRLLFLALGVGAAAVGFTLYRNRALVAKLCSKCTHGIKESMESEDGSEGIMDSKNSN